MARSSHWETIAFFLINKVTNGQNKIFYRSKLMSPDNLNFAVELLKLADHKEKPVAPEQTLQKTIQNLRDKGYIDFLRRGEYKLTINGYNEMTRIVRSSESKK